MLIAQAMRHKQFNRLPEQFVTAVSKQRFRLRVDQDDPSPSVHHDHRIGSGLDEQPESLFDHLSFSDVLDSTVVAHQSPVSIAVRNDLVTHPANASIPMENPVLDRAVLALGKCLRGVSLHQFAVIGMDHVEPEIRIGCEVLGSVACGSQTPRAVDG